MEEDIDVGLSEPTVRITPVHVSAKKITCRIYRPIPCGSRAPNIDTPPSEVSLTKEESRTIDPKLFPKGTCTDCQKITLHGLLKTDRRPLEYCEFGHNRRWPTNCPMCRVIFNCLNYRVGITENISIGLSITGVDPENDMHTGRQITSVDVFQPDDPEQHCFSSHGDFRIYAEAGSYASEFVPRLRPPSSNLSGTTFHSIARWIKNCDETHALCQSHTTRKSETATPYLPTRVIHVGSATRQPYLHVSQLQQCDRYIALSHCWGRISQVRTLNANIDKFRDEIILDSLSRTFQDAIEVTRQLAIEYIWIDSLCIVQDDKNDWLLESQRMGDVYANAYITIAATSAVNGNDGLDRVHPLGDWVRFPVDGNDKEKGYVWFTDASWESKTDLDDAPLNTRGWVVQEKLLSRRIIHFASSQVYWECKQRFYGQERENEITETSMLRTLAEFRTRLNAVPHIGPLPVERTNDIHERHPSLQLYHFYELWSKLIHYYCTRDFTKENDRLIALLGIIGVVEQQTGLRCVDGHWDDGSWQFVYDLMWSPDEKQRTLSLLDGDRRSRLCSSWSWASLEGPMQRRTYTNRIVDARKDWELLDLKDCTLYLLAIEDEVHVPWPSHPLKVSGMLRIFFKSGQPLEAGSHPGGTRMFPIKTEVSEVSGTWIYFDRKDEEPDLFYLSPVCIDLGYVACLALVQRHRPGIAEKSFERVGVSYIQRMGFDCGNVKLFETCQRSLYYII